MLVVLVLDVSQWMVDDNGDVLTVPCTMETVYGGMLYNQTLGGLRRVRLARLFARCLLSDILRAFYSSYSPSPFQKSIFKLFLLLLWLNMLSEVFVEYTNITDNYIVNDILCNCSALSYVICHHVCFIILYPHGLYSLLEFWNKTYSIGHEEHALTSMHLKDSKCL